LKIHYFCSFVDFIAYRFMLAFIMLISYQVCLVCKSFSKSCPHDQFVLNYSLSTKLYIARLSGTNSKPGNPNLTELVRSSPNKSSHGFHRTSLVSSPDKSRPLGIKPFDRPLDSAFGLLSSPSFSHRCSRRLQGNLGFPLPLLGDS
jgi:hypothetical protein